MIRFGRPRHVLTAMTVSIVAVSTLVACASNVTEGRSAPGPTGSGSTTRAQSTSLTSFALCDYGGLTAVNPTFVAGHFSWVVGAEGANLPLLHSLDPSIRVLYYFNSILTPTADAARYPASAFLVDPVLHARLTTLSTAPGGPTFPVYVMDPGSSAWQEYARSAVTKALASGYDGSLFDDVFADLTEMYPTVEPEGMPAYTATPSWYSAAAYGSSVAAFLSAMTAAAHPKTVVFNGLSTFPGDPELGFTSFTDGAVREGWTYDGAWGGGYRTGSAWQNLIAEVLAVPADKRFAVMAYGPTNDPAARMYDLASYLLVERPNTTYAYSSSCAQLSWFPEWDEPLGPPNGTVSSLSDLTVIDSQVYVRRFANGTVLVNPSTTGSPTINLDHPQLEIESTGTISPSLGGTGKVRLHRVTHIRLDPHTGVLLLDSP